MARKKERISLKDLKRTDEAEQRMETNISNGTTANIDISAKGLKISKEVLVGDYEKLSVSIPIDTFETLQDISRERRRVKQKHTMSQMVREALDLWLEHRNQTNSI